MFLCSWLLVLESIKWLQYLSVMLKVVVFVVNIVDREGRFVLVYCLDGWDRTLQIVVLVKILLDSYYRILEVLRRVGWERMEGKRGGEGVMFFGFVLGIFQQRILVVFSFFLGLVLFFEVVSFCFGYFLGSGYQFFQRGFVFEFCFFCRVFKYQQSLIGWILDISLEIVVVIRRMQRIKMSNVLCFFSGLILFISCLSSFFVCLSLMKYFW